MDSNLDYLCFKNIPKSIFNLLHALLKSEDPKLIYRVLLLHLVPGSKMELQYLLGYGYWSKEIKQEICCDADNALCLD